VDPGRAPATRTADRLCGFPFFHRRRSDGP
jgi:hypothetical protein